MLLPGNTRGNQKNTHDGTVYNSYHRGREYEGMVSFYPRIVPAMMRGFLCYDRIMPNRLAWGMERYKNQEKPTRTHLERAREAISLAILAAVEWLMASREKTTSKKK